MCPACWSMAAMVVAGAGSVGVGGLTALVVKKVRSKSAAPAPTSEKDPHAPAKQEESR